MEPATKDKKIAYILGNYPGKVETFVLNEMRGLEKLGFNICACPIHHVPNGKAGTARMPRAVCSTANPAEILVSHLYFAVSKPLTYLKCLFGHRSLGGKRVFLKSAYFARKIKKLGIRHVHAHFGWTATDSARVISRLAEVPFSFSAHAADIYYLPDNLEAKLKEAKFVLTCVKNNKTYISEKFGEELGRKVEVAYHGVDLEIFRPINGNKTVDILSIGNLVKKKGHKHLIEACAILNRRGIGLKCLIVGEGPEKERLSGAIRELGLEDSVAIGGRRPQAYLASLYAGSKVFVLPSFITETGDRDGIPNVLAEAMAMGLPVVSTDLPNISELIENGRDGILVGERDPGALADAIEGLLRDEGRRVAISKMAREKVEREFDAGEHIMKIADIFSRIAA